MPLQLAMRVQANPGLRGMFHALYSQMQCSSQSRSGLSARRTRPPSMRWPFCQPPAATTANLLLAKIRAVQGRNRQEHLAAASGQVAGKVRRWWPMLRKASVELTNQFKSNASWVEG
jgi:hypothetical protein